jgi:hypothetical protein
MRARRYAPIWFQHRTAPHQHSDDEDNDAHLAAAGDGDGDDEQRLQGLQRLDRALRTAGVV